MKVYLGWFRLYFKIAGALPRVSFSEGLAQRFIYDWLKILLMVAGWLACLLVGWLAGSLAYFLTCFLTCLLAALLAWLPACKVVACFGLPAWLACFLACWLACLLAWLACLPAWLNCLPAGFIVKGWSGEKNIPGEGEQNPRKNSAPRLAGLQNWQSNIIICIEYIYIYM